MRRLLAYVAAGLALCAAAPPAQALLQTCSVSATGVAFGTYSPSNAAVLNGTGTITVSCTGLLSLLDSWTITLDAGQHGSYAARKMQSGSSMLRYNLYTAAAHTVVWGDGTSGTGTVSDQQLLTIGSSSYPYTVYGQVAALQDLAPGTYTDVITVTVNY